MSVTNGFLQLAVNIGCTAIITGVLAFFIVRHLIARAYEEQHRDDISIIEETL